MEKRNDELRTTDWKSIYVLTLAAFLGALKMGMMGGNLWAYITELDRSITATFYGYMLSINSIGHIITALFAGFLANAISSSTPTLIAGKLFSIFGCFLFLLIELYEQQRKVILISMQLMFGLSVGLMSVVKAQIASSSTEEDRPRAVSMIIMSVTLGIASGPLLTSIFTLIKYPGIEFVFGLHLNFYTVPGYFIILTGVVSLILILTCFNGELREAPVALSDELKEAVETTEHGKLSIPFDTLAVAVCILTRIVFGLKLVYIQSLSGPYMMSVFRWTSAEYVFFSAVMHVVNGGIGVAFGFLYICGFMQKWVSPRLGITVAIGVQVIFFLLTYPYPFLSSRMAYETLALSPLNATIVLEPGCRSSYSWCPQTPAINVYVYVIAQLLVGVALPLVMLNMEILYSTILGPIKQGVMQGIFVICGELLHVVGPVFMTSVYESTGPTYIWQTMLVANAFILIVWFVFYHRMIPYSQMVKQKMGAGTSVFPQNASEQQLVGSTLKA
ncbi:Major facilitator superfamily domain-containing protein 8 [Aphelenchoides besseyi]|nr:Major facilitator superfamily domain-containing protein 8 [Aphelenchoides besseyi]